MERSQVDRSNRTGSALFAARLKPTSGFSVRIKCTLPGSTINLISKKGFGMGGFRRARVRFVITFP
ncbi:multidrug ABC transporter ATP-binding protein [Anopheles sinensis]|uniref:Multidrug ABC transporter ATP-binding protein n=1 Tax=Anopheles sinensis TaxID=74873 RepID=A0A084WBB7_ANOSI|nr:multidrug ABC transporter ATP-binding protein [Anopheles sinensis]